MYICANCGEVFDEPVMHFENHNPGMIGVYEYHLVSPCCKDSFFQADRCSICGEIIDPTEHHGLCLKCASQAVKDLAHFLKAHYTDEELEVVNDAFDGVALTEPEKAEVR